MSIDKSAYEDSCCPFDPSKYTGTPDTAPCPDTVDIKSIVASYDALISSGDIGGAGDFLNRSCATARDIGDWRSELSLQSELMGYHRRTNDKHSAMAATERGLELIREHRLGATVSGATVMLNAATTLKAYGQAEKSIPLFSHAARVFSDNLDPHDYRFGGLYNNMALSYSDCGDFEAAEKYFLMALSVIKHCPKSENELAVTCCNLAELYGSMGREADTETMLDRAYEHLCSPALLHDAYYAFTLSKCLPSFEYFGFFLYAKDLRRRLEECNERT